MTFVSFIDYDSMEVAHRSMRPHIQDQLKKKQKIEKNRETVRPTVINDALI